MKDSKLLKTVLTAALSAALLLPAAGAVDLSAPADEPEKPAYELSQRGLGFPIQVWGQAVELGENSLTLENSNEGAAYQKVVINVDEDTLILEAVNGESKTFADIQKDEALYAWVGPAMTKSLPPITTAKLILCGIPADFSVPVYAEVQSAAKTETGVDAYMTGDVVLHLGADTQYLSGAAGDIQPGARLLSWYSVVALSMPDRKSVV